LKQFQEWEEKRIRESGGKAELKYHTFDIL
jgi:hypothetical protein